MSHVAALSAQRSQKLAQARAIASKAEREGRDFTATERAQVDQLIAASRELGAKQTKAAQDDQLLDFIADHDRKLAGGAPRMGRHTLAAGPGSWGLAYSAQAGFKDSITPSGSITVPLLSAGIAELEDRPASILEAISFEGLAGTNSFQYTRETVQDLDATSVLPGHLKPTSDIELIPIQERARVIAHLTGGIDRSTIMDTPDVQVFLDNILRLGVMRALEAMVLAGDSTVPTLDDFDGILNASGTRHQTFSTSILETLRKALTTLQNARLSGPFMYVMSPTTWQNLELLTSTEHYVLGDPGNPGRTLPVDTARQALFGQRVALSPAMNDSQVILGDFGPASIRIREREGVIVDWSSATQFALPGDSGGATASGFETNKMQWRGEARYGLELRRPWAFVICALS